MPSMPTWLPRGLRNSSQSLGEWLRSRTTPRGAFTLVLTNDPDHGKTEDYARVFRGLNALGLKVTTAVFCTLEDDGSELARHCRPAETHTLADPAYRDLMLELHSQGHEIAFHGFSQVSNTREKFLEGLDIFRATFGHDPFTYIEHGGNPQTHPPGMCKRETLAVEGMDPHSPYHVADIIRQRIGCVWAWHDLLIDKSRALKADELFHRRDGVLFLRRTPMHLLDAVMRDLARGGGVFVGYTHFGYEGYPKEHRFRFENWTGPHLETALRGLEAIIARHRVTNCTLQEFARALTIGRDGAQM
jgi:hypothetical protein